MSCLTCGNPYTLLRKEKGCPGCGFSYCSKCLNNKVFLKRKNIEAKVCAKCKQTADSDVTPKVHVEPPEAYYKRLGLTRTNSQGGSRNIDLGENSKDYEIQERLRKLREDRVDGSNITDEELAERLKKIKGDYPSASEDELRARLANLKGIPVIASISKVAFQPPDTRTEQEQADALLKQYLDQSKIDSQYKQGFSQRMTDMESRLMKLKGSDGTPAPATPEPEDPEDEEATVKRIVQKYKSKAANSAKALLASLSSKDEDDEIGPSTDDELPFCEICNEDATVRCLGCKYIFCKRCYKEHKDDDEGCNRYVTYKPPRK